MIFPFLQQRMEQRGGLAALRIGSEGLVCLAKAAVRALQRQILKGGWAAATARDDMVNVKSRPVAELR